LITGYYLFLFDFDTVRNCNNGFSQKRYAN